jgi:hypothetical protein
MAGPACSMPGEKADCTGDSAGPDLKDEIIEA